MAVVAISSHTCTATYAHAPSSHAPRSAQQFSSSLASKHEVLTLPLQTGKSTSIFSLSRSTPAISSDRAHQAILAQRTMSEKSAFQLDARAQSPADQQVEVEVSLLAQKKKSIRPRVWKAVYCYFCHNMANSMHRFAIDHAQKAYLARWDEVMVPDVENLVDWIKLFMVSGTCSVETCVLSTSVSSG
jgi:hypothetical protein